MISLEAQGLFINGYPLPGNPYLPSLRVQLVLVQERLDLPQWVFGGIRLWISAEVIES